MLKGTLGAHGAVANLWSSAHTTQETKNVDLVHLLKKHKSRDDKRNDSERPQGSVDVFIIAYQIPQHKKAADSIEQETCLVDHGARIEREDQDTRKSAKEGPKQENCVKNAEPFTKNSFRKRECRPEHPNSDG